MSLCQEVLPWFCRCVGCARVLTGEIQVGVCKCKNLFCEVCFERNRGSACITCGVLLQSNSDLTKAAQLLFKGSQNMIGAGYASSPDIALEKVTNLRKDFDYAVDMTISQSKQAESQDAQFRTAEQRQNSGHDAVPINQAISQAATYGGGQHQGNPLHHPSSLSSPGAGRQLNRSSSAETQPSSQSLPVPRNVLPNPTTHYVQPRSGDWNPQQMEKSPAEERKEAGQESTPQPMVLDPSYPPIPIGSNQGGDCSYCGNYIYPNSKGRCGSCKKVNYHMIAFERDQFLSNKWSCPQCSFRNVHTNSTCINCNKRKGGGLSGSYR